MFDTITGFLELEMRNAKDEHGDFHSPHELWGVLKEEMDEYWDSIKADKEDLYELLQVVGVGLRYLRQKTEADPSLLFDINNKQEARWDR